MSEAGNHSSSSCPGKSAKRVFAQMTRASTPFFAASCKEDVDGRDNFGHDDVAQFVSLSNFVDFT
jgi:penicillin-binding protein 1C